MPLPSSSFEENNPALLHSNVRICFGVEIILVLAFLYSLLRLLKQSKSLPLAAFLIVAPVFKKLKIILKVRVHF